MQNDDRERIEMNTIDGTGATTRHHTQHSHSTRLRFNTAQMRPNQQKNVTRHTEVPTNTKQSTKQRETTSDVHVVFACPTCVFLDHVTLFSSIEYCALAFWIEIESIAWLSLHGETNSF
jgi:hypothetical protein